MKNSFHGNFRFQWPPRSNGRAVKVVRRPFTDNKKQLADFVFSGRVKDVNIAVDIIT